MPRRYVQEGRVIDLLLAGTVAADDVDVVGTGLLGIAQLAGVLGDTIPYAIDGVFKLPKVSAAVITAGQQVLWDVSAGAVDDDQATPATGDFLCGYAVESQGAGETEIAVLINRPAPSVT